MKDDDFDWSKWAGITESDTGKLPADYIRFDRQSDAQASLDEFCSCVERAAKADAAWKYAIVSMHSALQGYICVCLRNGNSFQTWNESHLKAWLVAYESDSQLPQPKLNFFMNLYDKAFEGEQTLNRDNINWLNETRNSLVHFNNDSFGIHRQTAIACCKEALDAIKLAPSKAKGVFFNSEDESEAYRQSCGKAASLLLIQARLHVIPG